MREGFNLSFVYPMYNEIDNIEKCIDNSAALARRLNIDFEIVVVDDASTDGCGQLVETLAKSLPQLKVLHNKVNRKLGGTLREGFNAASKDYILYMDSDLPLDFDDVARAIESLGDEDVLIGFRQNRDEPMRRKVLSRGYNLLIRMFFGLKVRDVNFSFKLFKRSILDKVKLSSEGSFIDAELLVEAHKYGYKIKQIGLPYYARIAGESTLASQAVINKTFSEMWNYWRTRF